MITYHERCHYAPTEFGNVWPLLNERSRRLMAATEARAIGYGGVSQVSRACGLSRKAIAKGIGEIAVKAVLSQDAFAGRGGGAGRRSPFVIPVYWMHWIA